MKRYTSPWAALLWSIALPGCGQIYNGNWILGPLILIGEFVINNLSHLNAAIYYTFHLDFISARLIINYQWGLFYPSLFCFSVWDAYNQAVKKNAQFNSITLTRTYLTGFLFGLNIGMVIGISCFNNPVTDGLLVGLASAILFAIIEALIRKINHSSKSER